MKKITLLMLLLGCTTAFANPGTYVSIEAGAVNTTNGVFHFHDNGLGARFAAGTLFGAGKLTRGFEVGAMFYPHVNSGSTGKFASGNTVKDSYNLDLLGVLKYTFDSHFLLLGKLGPTTIHQTMNGSTALGVNKHQTNNSLAAEAVLGAGYQMSPLTAVTLTTSATSGIAHASTLLLGLTHSF